MKRNPIDGCTGVFIVLALVCGFFWVVSGWEGATTFAIMIIAVFGGIGLFAFWSRGGESSVHSGCSSSGGTGGSWYSPPVVGGGKYPVFIDHGSSGMGYQESVNIGGANYRIERHDSYLGRTIVSNTQPYAGGETKVIDSQGKVSDYSPYDYL
jgi:hypothetical protein